MADESALFPGQQLRLLPESTMKTFGAEGKEASQKGNGFLFKHLFSFTFSTKHKSSALNPHLLVTGLFLPSESQISGQPDLLTHWGVKSGIYNITKLLKIGIVYLNPKIGQ